MKKRKESKNTVIDGSKVAASKVSPRMGGGMMKKYNKGMTDKTFTDPKTALIAHSLKTKDTITDRDRETASYLEKKGLPGVIKDGKINRSRKKMGGGMMNKPMGYSKGGGYDAGTPGKVRDVVNNYTRVGNRLVGKRITKRDMDMLNELGTKKISKMFRSKKFSKGGGADTGRVGELKSKIAVATDKLKKHFQKRKRRPDYIKPPERKPMIPAGVEEIARTAESFTPTGMGKKIAKKLTGKMGGGMMQKPMGYKSGTMVMARGCKLGRKKPTKMY